MLYAKQNKTKYNSDLMIFCSKICFIIILSRFSYRMWKGDFPSIFSFVCFFPISKCTSEM